MGLADARLRVAGAAGGEQLDYAAPCRRTTFSKDRSRRAVYVYMYVPATYRRGCCAARADTGEATARAFITAAILQLALVAVLLERGSWLGRGRGSCSLQGLVWCPGGRRGGAGEMKCTRSSRQPV